MTKEQFEKAEKLTMEIGDLKSEIRKAETVRAEIDRGKEYSVEVEAYSIREDKTYILGVNDDCMQTIIGVLLRRYETQLTELEKEFENL